MTSSSPAAPPNPKEPPIEKEEKATWAKTICDMLGMALIIGFLMIALVIKDHFHQNDKCCLEKILELGRTITPELQRHFSWCNGDTWVCHCQYLATLQRDDL